MDVKMGNGAIGMEGCVVSLVSVLCGSRCNSADVSGKGAVLTVLGPWAATRYSPRAAFHYDALVLHSLESSRGTTTPTQPSVEPLNHRGIRDPGEPAWLHFPSAFFL